MRLVCLGLALCGLSGLSFATRLTFDQTNGSVIPSTATTTNPLYGDRVTAATMGTYSYGTEGGFTPNVTVAYASQFSSGTINGLGTWGSNYGNLTNVVWTGSTSTENPNNGFLTLTADPGFVVQLQSFRTALWSSGPALYTDIRVTDGGSNLLYSSSAANPVGGNVLHDFSLAPLTATQLTIQFGQGWWIALDDVTFSQAVPEPGTLALLGLGLPLLMRRRTRG